MNSLEGFSEVKVLVVGDLMLDCYWWGTVSRISPEAPVPIVKLKNKTYAVGGAANVAANVAGLGAESMLIGLVGKDADADLFARMLSEMNVAGEHIIFTEERPTTVKTRIIAHSQQVLRLDQEEIHKLSEAEHREALEKFVKVIDEVDIVIISDYAKGFLSEKLLADLFGLAKEKNKPVLVDPKGKDYKKYKGATLLTPNKKEAAESCKLDEDDENLVETAGRQLIEELGLESILITRGEEGMSILQKGKTTRHLKASAREIYDVTGAGDTVIAALAVGLGAGIDLEDAAEIANRAAGIVVGQVGTTVIKKSILEEDYGLRNNLKNA